MDNRDSTFSWGWVIFIVLILWFFIGGNMWNRGCNNWGGCDRTTNCEVERRGLITAAETNFRIIDQANATRDAVTAASATIGTKIDFYEYQNLRDKLAKAEMDNYFLKGQIAADQRFGALEKQISTISCNMLKKPDVTGIGAVCPNAGIINGLGIESSAQVARGYNYGCGCNGNYPLV
jgi:hypothetical protein